MSGTDDAPPTDAPPTDAPATDAPATDAPATDAPPTDASPTDAPAPAADWGLDHYLSLPRCSTLAVSPDGARLVTAVATVAPDGKRHRTALWQLDPAAATPPRRLTRSAVGEAGAAHLPDGSLLFASARPDPDAEPDGDDPVPSLWRLPAGGGEAELLATVPSGVEGVRVASGSGTILLVAGAHPGTTTTEEDAAKEKARKDAGVSAQLFESYPIRSWDHYLGPRERRLLVADLADDGTLGELRTLTPAPGHALDEVEPAISPDGTTVVTPWTDWSDLVGVRIDLLAIDVATGEVRTIAAAPGFDHETPAFSPDGTTVACIRTSAGDPEHSPRPTLWLVDLATGAGRDLTPDLDLWPMHPVWLPDGAALAFTADQGGRTLPFRVDVASGAVTRLAAEGLWDSLVPSPDGTAIHALRSSWSQPPGAVRIDATTPDQEPVAVPTPGLPVDPPGEVRELVATADDGTPVHSWLVLPAGATAAEPVPLAVFMHGGPLGTWSGWSWRWNPQLLAARGWAVLLPDPAISTGYGQAFIDRGRGRWGDRPYTDVMAAVDAAVALPEVDGARTAAMGGSFGGYLANWVAGHTDRFRAIVTHASLWELRGFHGTTDAGVWWEREFGDPYADASRFDAASPHHHVASIRTPLLVIHGELDHRVPISEGLRLWTDLKRHGAEASFLYFPDENHWILKPQNTRLWYETIFAFLDHHVLGRPWQRPSLL